MKERKEKKNMKVLWSDPKDESYRQNKDFLRDFFPINQKHMFCIVSEPPFYGWFESVSFIVRSTKRKL